MELRPIPARDWADWYTQELCASFPACECKPLEAIRALAAEGRYELLGLYDGAALLGYATLWSTPEWPDYVLLDYLGVTAARRNEPPRPPRTASCGSGGRALWEGWEREISS